MGRMTSHILWKLPSMLAIFLYWLVVDLPPLKNDGVKVSWDDDIPDIWKECSKPPTRKWRIRMWHNKSDQWGWGRLRPMGLVCLGLCAMDSALTIHRYIVHDKSPKDPFEWKPIKQSHQEAISEGQHFLGHWILLLHSPSSTCLKARIGSKIPWFMCKWSTNSVPRQETHISQLATHGEPQKNVFIRVESAVNALISTKMCGNHWDESVLDTV